MSNYEEIAKQAEALKENIWDFLDHDENKQYIEEKTLIRNSMNELLDHIDLMDGKKDD